MCDPLLTRAIPERLRHEQLNHHTNKVSSTIYPLHLPSQSCCLSVGWHANRISLKKLNAWISMKFLEWVDLVRKRMIKLLG